MIGRIQGRKIPQTGRVTVEDLARALRTLPVRLCDGLPDMPRAGGLYAWWSPVALLPGVPGPVHPSEPDWRLLYVGEGVNLHHRIMRTHLAERSGQSALRRVLAAVLSEREGWTAVQGARRVQVAPEHEGSLTTWMTGHLGLTWALTAAHATLEREVIAAIHPPLNHRHNRAHPAYPIVMAARRAWRVSAEHR